MDFPFSRKSLVVTLTLGRWKKIWHSQDMSFWILTWGKIWKFRQKSRCITNLLESLVSKNPETNMQSPKQIFAKQKNWKIGIVCPCRHKRTLFWRFQTSCRFRRIDDMLFFGLATKGAIYWCEGAMDGGVGGQTAIGAAAISWHLSFFFLNRKS